MQSKGRKRSRKIYKKQGPFSTFGIMIIVFLVLFIISSIVFLYMRYSFTKERANLTEYYKGVGENEVSIYINDVLMKDGDGNISNKALYENDAVYLPLSWVKSKLNNRFYYAKDIERIRYCLADEVITRGVNDMHQVGNAAYVLMKDEPYLLMEFVSDYTNIRFEKYTKDTHKRLFIYDIWEKENFAFMSANESSRWRGGNKSPIIEDLNKGEQVKVLDKMVKWSKVKTLNGYVGYVRNTRLQNEISKIPESTYVEPKREWHGLSEKVVLGFHQVTMNYPANRLPELLKDTAGMNVIAPTLYAFKNDDGELRSVANLEYVKACHNRGLKVWPTINNFDILDVNEKLIFSNTFTRKNIIDRIIKEIELCEYDGINLDMESLSKDVGEDYVQFVRELSVELNKRKITLSIDAFIPYEFNNHYDMQEIGEFADYVVVMCYDEHYSGSKTAGSVSSLPYVIEGIDLSLDNVERSKLVVGLPFYTRIWTTDKDGKVSSRAYASKLAEQYSNSYGIKFEYDDATGQNYGSVINEDGAKIECWLEDELSLTMKMDQVKYNNLAGTAAWKLSFERENFFDIINMNK